MNSEWAEPPQEQGNTGKATPGALLAAQREAMGWTVEQIADQLKLAVRQVKALEAGDYAALPNMAVTRGFVRAYAKVLKMDAAPLVAMIEAAQPTSPEVVVAPRKDLAASFSESRFPSMTGRSSSAPAGWLIGLAAVVVVGAAGAYAYQSGLIPASLFERKEEVKTAETPAIDTTLVKPGQEATTLQQPNVPLISVPPQGEQAAAPASAAVAPPADAPAATPAPAAATPAPAPAATAPAAAPVAAAPAAAAAAPTPAAAAPAAAGTGHQLVLKVTEDSWVEIRRPGTTSLISRVVKAGSTETFDIKDPALLIIGKPAGVEATLGGAPLPLPLIPGGTISRVNIK
ncbi:helix-turn-helix domain-containing protein [Duganella sp.]|uniref:helix-turn-helix domain-containing protein n=1 Tax=Duganella sp. TaxID=1904440 RepID=UPI0031D10F9C